MSTREHIRSLVALVLGVVALLFIPPTFSIYIRTVFMFMMLYVILALSWNIISGYTGYLSLGQVVFYGIGSYATGILLVAFRGDQRTLLLPQIVLSSELTVFC